MDSAVFERCAALLRQELVPALGCTEPSAVAYAAACAAQALGCEPQSMDVYCSDCVIKNVHSVTVPNSGGMKGIPAAALLGALIARPERKLQILEEVQPAHLTRLRKLLDAKACRYHLAEGVEPLYIRVEVCSCDARAEAEVSGTHTNLTRLTLNGRPLSASRQRQETHLDASGLSFSQLWEFSTCCDLEPLRPALTRMIQYNTVIAQEGLTRLYGVGVGMTLLQQSAGQDVAVRARAKAAAGSDARMNGCPCPVVIVSGSGNQGLTCSLPVIEYARELGEPEEKLLRALILSVLVTLRLKAPIGSLSAFCGAVCAAAGAGAGVAFLLGGGLQTVCDTITYTLGTVGGIVCDGAKSSCAAKISSALETALFGVFLSMNEHRCFSSGDGLIRCCAEQTVEAYGKMASKGMRQTNLEILQLMLDADAG